MPVFGKEIISQRRVLPNGLNEPIFFWRNYIEMDGQMVEIMRVFDCEAHCQIREAEMDICLINGIVEPISTLTTKGGSYRYYCDHCGKYSPEGVSRDEAEQRRIDAGWIRRKVNGKWEDICPECQKREDF